MFNEEIRTSVEIIFTIKNDFMQFKVYFEEDNLKQVVKWIATSIIVSVTTITLNLERELEIDKGEEAVTR